MARLARRWAGPEIEASAQRAADDTLDLEEQAFAEIDRIYDELALDIRRFMLAEDDWSASSYLWVLIAVMVIAAATEAGLVIAALVAEVVAVQLEALKAELLLVEATFAGRYGGLTAAVFSGINIEEIVRAARGEILTRAEQRGLDHAERIEQRRRAWVFAREPREVLVDRLTSDRVTAPGQSTGEVQQGAGPAKSDARSTAVGIENDARIEAIDEFARNAPARVYKQVLAVIDSRTTIVCLHCVGQVRPVEEPFDTINGRIQRPPFHWGCRSTVIPWLPGMRGNERARANAELARRSLQPKRLSPQEVPPRIPGVPPRSDGAALPARYTVDTPFHEVPLEWRLQFMRAYPERFSFVPNSESSMWVRDGDLRWLLMEDR